MEETAIKAMAVLFIMDNPQRLLFSLNGVVLISHMDL